MACRDLVEEDLHAAGVDVRQYQTIELAGANIHRTKNIGVLMRQHALAKRTHWFGCPTPAHVRDAPKTRLVLKHQFDGLVLRPVFADLGKDLGEFFSTPSELPGRFWGWRLSGASLSPVVAVQQVVG
jgi:hypothetical protein